MVPGAGREDFVARWWAIGCIWTAAILYFSLWPVVSYDVPQSLFPWYAHILEVGRIEAFSEPFANYTPPYLYLLSLFSLLDPWLPPIAVLKIMAALQSVALAGSVFHLLRVTDAPHAAAGGASLLLLPPVVLNGPVLAQCDPIWVAACVVGVSEAIRRRPMRMLLWFGLAGAIKLQAIFLAPFAIGMMLQLKAPLGWVAIPPLVYVALMVPAALAGWPAFDLVTIYVRQISWANDFINNAANPWTLGNFAPGLAKQMFWIGYVAAAGAALAVVAIVARANGSPASIIRCALLSAIALPYLLPRMHERYFFAADVLAFALAWMDRRSLAIAFLVISSSTLALIGYLVGNPIWSLAGALLMGAALVLVVRAIVLEPRELRS